MVMTQYVQRQLVPVVSMKPPTYTCRTESDRWHHTKRGRLAYERSEGGSGKGSEGEHRQPDASGPSRQDVCHKCTLCRSGMLSKVPVS